MLLSELASLGEALHAIHTAAAKERLRAAGRSSAPGRPAETCAKLGTGFGGDSEPGAAARKTRTVVGEALGMSGTSYDGLKFVYRTASDLRPAGVGDVSNPELVTTEGKGRTLCAPPVRRRLEVPLARCLVDLH